MNLKDAQLNDLGNQARAGIRTVESIKAILSLPHIEYETLVELIGYALAEADHFLKTGHALADQKGDTNMDTEWKAPEVMFRKLDPTEEQEFRKFARDTWKPGDHINPTWHPAVRDEIEKIREETQNG